MYKRQIHGDAFAYLLPKLNEVAEQLGLTSPETFTFEDEAFYKEYGIKVSPKVAKKIKTQAQWHPCPPAVDVFRKLHAHFEKLSQDELLNFQRATKVDFKHMILEMKLFADILEKGAKNKDMFRIEAMV